MTLDARRPLKVIGCGGHGRVIADIARAAGEPFDGFLDDFPDKAPSHLQVTGPIWPEIRRFGSTHRFVVAIGDSHIRRSLAEALLGEGRELATLVHPSAVIAPDVTIGEGTAIMAGVIINTGSRIGRFAVLNSGAILDHDNIVDDNVHVSPGCSLAGNVWCRHDSFIGTGVSIIPKIIIGVGAYVAAGATVIHDVPSGVLVAGCPAIVKKML